MVRLVTNPPPFKTPEVNPTVPADAEVERWARAYLRHAPLSLVLREINRLVALESVADQKGPVLDVGCGDGFWWQVRKDGGAGGDREVYGIDISASEIAQAKSRIHASLTDVSRETPFAGTQFREIIGNCSLEHVPDIDAALLNLRHAAADGARLLMFVPTPKWAYQGRLQQQLLAHAPRLAMTLSGAANGFFQHWHLYNHKVWQRLLEQNGWRVRAAYGLGSARSEFLFRLFLPPAFAQFLAKQLTGFYPAKLYKMLPDGLLSPLAKLVRWAVTDPLVDVESPHAYEYLIIAETAELPGALTMANDGDPPIVPAQPSGDYFANHVRARQFPWTLYHQPLERDLARFLREVAAEHRDGEVLVVGCGLLHEIDAAPAGLRFTVADIDARAVDAVLAREDARIIGGEVVEPEAPLDGALGCGRFAAIYAKEVVEHVLAWPSWLAGLRRALVPGGRLWLSTPNYGEPWLPAIESTVLEVIARRAGFSRRDIHPTRFSRGDLLRGMTGAGFTDVRARATPTRLALTAWGRAPG